MAQEWFGKLCIELEFWSIDLGIPKCFFFNVWHVLWLTLSLNVWLIDWLIDSCVQCLLSKRQSCINCALLHSGYVVMTPASDQLLLAMITATVSTEPRPHKYLLINNSAVGKILFVTRSVYRKMATEKKWRVWPKYLIWNVKRGHDSEEKYDQNHQNLKGKCLNSEGNYQEHHQKKIE